MEVPKISIITVCYNSEATIEKTIRSVIDHNYPAKEFIIIDGKSSDRTVDIIRQYEEEIDFWVTEPDRGIPDALNKGIERSTGEWLYFLSSDDVFYDNSVLRRIFCREELSEYSVIYGSVWFLHEKKKYDGRFNPKKIIEKDICHQAQLFRRSVFEKAGLYEIRYRYASDWVLNLRTFIHPEIKWKYVDEILAIFNDDGRTSNNIDVDFTRNKRKLLLHYFRPSVPLKLIYANSYLEMYLACKEGKYLFALWFALKSLIYMRSFDHLKTFVFLLFNPASNPIKIGCGKK